MPFPAPDVVGFVGFAYTTLKAYIDRPYRFTLTQGQKCYPADIQYFIGGTPSRIALLLTAQSMQCQWYLYPSKNRRIKRVRVGLRRAQPSSAAMRTAASH